MWCKISLIIFSITVVQFCQTIILSDLFLREFLYHNNFSTISNIPNIRKTVQNNNNILEALRDNYDAPYTFDEYDFIIVGSGSAGSVIANRLTEVSHWNVLLLEAGKGEIPATDVPLLAPLFQMTDYNWGHKMERQENICLGMNDQLCLWPRGKAVGGTTVINYMIYTRGNKIDYDRMSANGNYGWSYEEVLPYFLKSENANLYKPVINTTYHNKGGYLSVEHINWRSKLSKAFVKAGQALGYDEVDYNGENQLGISFVQGNTLLGRRHSAGKAFLMPIRKRRNLHILSASRVTKILIDPTTKEAYGVEYVRNKRKFEVRARKEVILSAGAFNSPQLLMLSGIGPADHLNELGIPVLQNLPVGQSLYDHISFPGVLFHINTTDIGIIDDGEFYLQRALDWTAGKGEYTSIGGVEALAYMKTKISTEKESLPDAELIFVCGSLLSDAGTTTRGSLGMSDEVYNAVYKEYALEETWSVLPMLLHPKSKGYMRLKDKNPFHRPKLYGNYYTDPDNVDLNTMVEAIKEIIRFSKTPQMQRFASTLHDVPIPGCKQFGFGSDDYWKCAAKYLAISLHHQVATCRMGPENDAEAVVDPELRVYGIKRLRVADTSIIPQALSAHTNAPAYMVGEKASDMIKRTWNQL